MDEQKSAHTHSMSDEALGTTRVLRRECVRFRVPKMSKKLKEMEEKGLNAVLEKLQLVYSSSESKLTGSKPIEEATSKAYEKHYKGLKYFFSMIGDYESLLILQSKAPKKCPSMNVDSICLFFDWELKPRGKLLGIKDIRDVEIKATGSWAGPVNVEQCRSAITAVHQARGEGGPYVEPCDECNRLYDTGVQGG